MPLLSREEEEEQGVEKRLLSAHRALRASLDRSLALSRSLDSLGERLDDIRCRLPSLVSAIRPILAPPGALPSLPSHINHAVGPAASVLRVFDALHGLEPSLLSPSPLDLPSYLPLVQRLEEALLFLSSDATSLALQWLHEILDYLRDLSAADPFFLSSLRSLLSPPSPPLDGGLLSSSLDRLESEFRLLLLDHSSPLPLDSSSFSSSSSSPLPPTVVQKLVAISRRLHANGRLDRCASIYADARGSTLRRSLDGLDLSYLDLSPSDFTDVRSIEPHISRWGSHLELAVRHLLDAEHSLCRDVLGDNSDDDEGGDLVLSRCFADIAARAGILAFLRFGRTVTESRKDPIKLLKLLDIFGCLNRLRLDFNRLFGGKACAEIQHQTRDLVRRVVDGSCEIFSELLVQVELQRDSPPPPNGSVPKLVAFLTDYCNRLLGPDYRPLLVQVLVIHGSWKKKERFQERLLDDAVVRIVRALEHNFETCWSKHYDDPVLHHVFSMNTHWHLYKSLRATRLGELLGDGWLREHEQFKDYYLRVYLGDSWGKLPGLLSREGLILFSGGRATARDLVKRRLKAFNHAFDEMYRRQSAWVIPDRELRDKVCQQAIQSIVPAYRSYMQNYGPLVEQQDGSSSGKYAKYSAQALEHMLGSLFQQRPAKSSLSFKASHSNGKVVDDACQYQSAPNVA